jgi:hypothetical protein
MKARFVCTITLSLLPLMGAAQPTTKVSASIKRTADGHPDLSGVWQLAIYLPTVALKKEVNQKLAINTLDQSARPR